MMDQEDVELLQRSLEHATGRHTGVDLDVALDDLGWADALGADRRAAVASLFDLQGRANVTSGALGQVMAHALGLGSSTLVLPAFGRTDPPGSRSGDGLTVDGLALAGRADAQALMVVTTDGEHHRAVVVAPDALILRTVGGIDPSLGLLEITGRTDGWPGAGDEVAPAPWEAAIALGQLAVAHELVGASRTMLDLARQHALERVQFGQAISGFQAVRHRLAETLVAIEMAEAVIDAAWLDGSVVTAGMAKAVAGRGAKTTARHCQQVLAGIGFTAEHAFHRYVRRTLVLDGLLGSTAVLTKALGAGMIETRQLPRLLPL
jgi:Acyl-CoA dehydrogenase, C-terminal domain